MAGFWDFLSTLVSSKKDKDSSSVVVKNYISGNNNQKITPPIKVMAEGVTEPINPLGPHNRPRTQRRMPPLLPV